MGTGNLSFGKCVYGCDIVCLMTAQVAYAKFLQAIIKYLNTSDELQFPTTLMFALP